MHAMKSQSVGENGDRACIHVEEKVNFLEWVYRELDEILHGEK